MPNTTNFNFPTPADTDLVKDGASAIRSLGNSIDTAFVDLKGGTTGQVLSKASNTDLDYSWTTPTDQTPLTTKGDLFTFTTVDARLGVGTNGQVLTADSAEATGLKWATPSGGAGNMVQVATGTLSGGSVTLSSLSSYTDLVLILFNVTMAANGGVFVRPNNNSGSNYAEYYVGSRLDGALVKDGSQTETKFAYNYAGGNQISGANGFYLSKFTNCKNAGFTDYELSASYRNSGSFDYYVNHKGVYKVSEAVSSLVIIANGTTFSGGTYILFGA